MVKWNETQKMLGEQGAFIPTMEGQKGLTKRLGDEAARQRQQGIATPHVSKKDLKRAEKRLREQKRQQKLDRKQALRDRKAEKEAHARSKRENKTFGGKSTFSGGKSAGGVGAPVSGSFTSKMPSMAASGTSSNGDDAEGVLKFFAIILLIGAVFAFFKWIYAEIHASLEALTGLTASWPTISVIVLAFSLPPILGYVLYDRWVRQGPYWTKGVLALLVPTLIVTGFTILSLTVI
ncbi:hypothetical protein [Henriciella litoralis]|uniref:hypothetical protein n=1 Tax=Henriciella litoralis TaxID=568102 RepID=UPI0009FCE90A|nr:hypothetical protein [Henriciella litoralis]